MDADTNDMCNNGLGAVVTRDGQGSPTADQPMNGFNHTDVGDATARDQYASAGQVQDGVLTYAVGGGSADAITASFSPPTTAFVDGELHRVKASAANATTTPTYAPDGLTAHTITKFGGKALSAGDIYGAGHDLLLEYSATGTRWELLNPARTGLTLLSSQTASASSSLVFALPVGFARYEIHIDDLIVSTAGANVFFQTSQDGGTVFQTTSYLYALQGIDAASGARATSNSASAAGILIAASASNSSTAPVNVERISLHNPAATSVKQIDVCNSSWVDNASSDPVMGSNGGGRYFGNTNAYTAFRIVPSTGNLASGVISLYGST